MTEQFIFFSVITLFVSIILYVSYKLAAVKRRRKFLDNYQFPERLNSQLQKTYPHLEKQDIDDVIEGLREYFQVCNIAGRKSVAMPSQAVDLAWHEFILFTKRYEQFCKKGLGRFLHHTPAEAMSSPTQAQDGIKRAWRIACVRADIDPHKPKQLPPLFTLDSRLAIEDGFTYTLDKSECRKKQRKRDSSAGAGTVYCVSHIGCASGCASDTEGGGCMGGGSDGCSSGCGGD